MTGTVSKRATLLVAGGLFAVTVVGVVSAANTAYARGGGTLSSPGKAFVEKVAARANGTLEETPAQFARDPAVATDARDPGWFLRLVDFCGHLDGSGIACVEPARARR